MWLATMGSSRLILTECFQDKPFVNTRCGTLHGGQDVAHFLDSRLSHYRVSSIIDVETPDACSKDSILDKVRIWEK